MSAVDRRWDDFRFFLAVAKTGKLVLAAQMLKSDPSTVSRRVARLQESIGCKLLQRHKGGMSLTPVGQEVFKFAITIEEVMSKVENLSAEHCTGMNGTVTVRASSGVGSVYLIPRLPALQHQHPAISINFEAWPAPEVAMTTGPDIIVTTSFLLPSCDDYVCEPVGKTDFKLYASERYIRLHGLPTKEEDLSGHKFLLYVDNCGDGPWATWRDIIDRCGELVLRSNRPSAICEAMGAGLGIAIFPKYAMDNVPYVKEIPIKLDPPAEIFLCQRKVENSVRHVDVAYEFMHNLFAGDRDKYFY